MTSRKQRNAAGSTDERIKRTEDPQRGDQSQHDRAKQDDGLVMSAHERERLLRTEWLHEALPNPPGLPGWHTCWLTTTSQYDPLQKRLRMGYQLVKAEEIPSFESMKVHSGQYPGFIMVNEMILAKIPLDVYNQMMRALHHDMPQEEEQAIREGAKQFADANRDSAGNELMRLEEGMEELGRPRRAPTTF